MIRESFLRNIVLEQVSNNKWDLPGIGTHEIGFGICPESGLILQSPSPKPEEIQAYYEETATYINPGREGKPSVAKEKDLNRFITIVKDVIGDIPEKVFQVGCSDGYTLNRFREAGSQNINGIDPSIASHNLANKLYGINTLIGTIEDYNNDEKYELVILTHVLEHLFNPLNCLQKCSNMQMDSGWLLIEVPLFERLDRFPPGMLTLEHLNYFSEGTLIETITRSGYQPYFIGKYFDNNEYPVITVVCGKSDSTQLFRSDDYSKNNYLLKEYVKQEKILWGKIENNIKSKVSKGTNVYIYGAGIHTSQLLAFTQLKKYLNILGLLDSSPTKWGKQLGDFLIHNPEEIDFNIDDVIIISSYASEKEIFLSLKKHRNNGVEIILLYGGEI